MNLYRYKLAYALGDFVNLVQYLYPVIENCQDFYRFTLRLREINCPELRGSESEAGFYVKEEVEHLINNTIVYISNIAYDKYHRLLASIKFYNSHQDAYQDLATYIKDNFM